MSGKGLGILNEPLDPAVSSREERKATGRIIAVIVALFLILLAIYHAWIRKTAVLAGVIVPALIMILYTAWVLFLAKREKQRRLLAESNFRADEARLSEVISTSSNETNPPTTRPMTKNSSLSSMSSNASLPKYTTLPSTVPTTTTKGVTSIIRLHPEPVHQIIRNKREISTQCRPIPHIHRSVAMSYTNTTNIESNIPTFKLNNNIRGQQLLKVPTVAANYSHLMSPKRDPKELCRSLSAHS